MIASFEAELLGPTDWLERRTRSPSKCKKLVDVCGCGCFAMWHHESSEILKELALSALPEL